MIGGTAVMCDCHDNYTACKYDPDVSVLEIRAKSRGTYHTAALTLQSLVRMLDPKGTSFMAVSGSAL